jgi:hypothetical protein
MRAKRHPQPIPDRRFSIILLSVFIGVYLWFQSSFTGHETSWQRAIVPITIHHCPSPVSTVL